MKTKQNDWFHVAGRLAVAVLGGLALCGAAWHSGGAGLAIVTQPQWQTNCAGDTATFSVIATGAPPVTYQWQLRMTLGYSNIVDGTNAELILADGQGSFSVCRVIVSNLSGSVTSVQTRLYISYPVEFTQQPTSASVEVGSTFTNTGGWTFLKAADTRLLASVTC